MTEINDYNSDKKNHHLQMNAESFDDFWKQIDVGEEHSLLVTGYSMQPFLLHNRSIVFIEKVENYIPLKSDIVLFQRKSGEIVLHRIKKVLENGDLVINGDAQSWTEIINKSQVCAKVTQICRKKRIFSVKSLSYRVLVTLWRLIFPIRPFLFKVYYKLKND